MASRPSKEIENQVEESWRLNHKLRAHYHRFYKSRRSRSVLTKVQNVEGVFETAANHLTMKLLSSVKLFQSTKEFLRASVSVWLGFYLSTSSVSFPRIEYFFVFNH